MDIFIAIYLMIFSFLAGPSLSASSDSAEHKNAISATISAINIYQSEHRGRLPTSQEIESEEFLPEKDFEQGIKDKYIFSTNTEDKKGTVVVNLEKDCNGADAPRRFSVSTILEDNKRYCVDS